MSTSFAAPRRPPRTAARDGAGRVVFALVAIAVLLVAPQVVYPVFLMKVLCFALFACAFNLLLGYVGLLSFRPRHVLRRSRLHLRPCR